MPHKFVVVKDPVLGFYRLRRSDSPDVAGLDPYWSGDGLRAGYDAMIRGNKDLKGAERYVVCRSAATGTGRAFKGAAPSSRAAEWEVVETVGSWLVAKAKAKKITEQKPDPDIVEKEEFERSLKPYGIKLLPGKPTAKDKEYAAWLAKRNVSCLPE